MAGTTEVRINSINITNECIGWKHTERYKDVISECEILFKKSVSNFVTIKIGQELILWFEGKREFYGRVKEINNQEGDSILIKGWNKLWDMSKILVVDIGVGTNDLPWFPNSGRVFNGKSAKLIFTELINGTTDNNNGPNFIATDYDKTLFPVVWYVETSPHFPWIVGEHGGSYIRWLTGNDTDGNPLLGKRSLIDNNTVGGGNELLYLVSEITPPPDISTNPTFEIVYEGGGDAAMSADIDNGLNNPPYDNMIFSLKHQDRLRGLKILAEQTKSFFYYDPANLKLVVKLNANITKSSDIFQIGNP